MRSGRNFPEPKRTRDFIARAGKLQEQQRKDDIAALPPGAGAGGGGFTPAVIKLQRDTATAIPDATTFDIPWTIAIFESAPGPMWAGGADVIAPVEGLYGFAGSLAWSVGFPSDTNYEVWISRGGVLVATMESHRANVSDANRAVCDFAGTVYLVATESIVVQVVQESGLARSLQTTGGGPAENINTGPVFAMWLLAPATA